MITIKKGLNLPIQGKPEQHIDKNFIEVEQVAVLGEDYNGMRPSMKVKVGDSVKKGQVLFEDKKNPGVLFTAPASGKVVEIHRGYQRVLQSVVIHVQGAKSVRFKSFDVNKLPSLSPDKVRQNLIESGMWTAFRTRPYSKVPAIDSEPAGIFVNAMDTNPLAAEPDIIIAEQKEAFEYGLMLISRISEQAKLFLSKAPGANIPSIDGYHVEEFAGVHPAGLSGTHIHHLMPASAQRTVWHINYQDVIAIGHLFTTGELYTDRVVSIAGPYAKQPRLVRTQMGADLEALAKDEMKPGLVRLISGSILNGTHAKGPHAFLGRYHMQVSLIEEDAKKELLGWIYPGKERFSATRAFWGHLISKKLFNLTSSTRGSPRSMVPIGVYDRIMPLDVIPTLLLRDLISRDTDSAQKMGCLELDEEDLALCTFTCPGKYDHGMHLRACLEVIEREG
jgi:Na+-transporting NADH:ubiquinone oxidoreductase subunit A